jgi:Na+/proline symporter
MAGFSSALFYIGIPMGYLYLLMGVIVSSAVIPATLTVMWKRQNVVAATATPILGLTCSLVAWLVTAKRESGSLSISSTGANNPMLTGNVMALFSPLVFVPILTYGFGADNYDYESMKKSRTVEPP